MIKLLRLFARIFVIAIAGVALIRVFVILFVTLIYGGRWPWGMNDLWFVLKQGTLAAAVFWIFATVAYIRRRG
ncbi:hypothetical protein [Paraburkholderia azotifigens]|uniref:DUF4175 domain-containing protein n=1 Tax=Paraburkholderia azotifigens TaxID=2057004 RepID=A0ABU9R1F5_9BURK